MQYGNVSRLIGRKSIFRNGFTRNSITREFRAALHRYQTRRARVAKIRLSLWDPNREGYAIISVRRYIPLDGTRALPALPLFYQRAQALIFSSGSKWAILAGPFFDLIPRDSENENLRKSRLKSGTESVFPPGVVLRMCKCDQVGKRADRIRAGRHTRRRSSRRQGIEMTRPRGDLCGD